MAFPGLDARIVAAIPLRRDDLHRRDDPGCHLESIQEFDNF